jgi:hypothetical protein
MLKPNTNFIKKKKQVSCINGLICFNKKYIKKDIMLNPPPRGESYFFGLNTDDNEFHAVKIIKHGRDQVFLHVS